MRYYVGFVVFGLLMGGVCALLEFHPVPPPAIAMIGLFGAHEDGAAMAAGPCGRACRRGPFAAPLPVSCAIQEKSLPA